jgi:hypothetical protein
MKKFWLVLPLLVGCGCNPYRIAWSTTAMVREAAFQTEGALAKGLREKVKSCSQQYQAVIDGHNACIKACGDVKPVNPDQDVCKVNCRKGHEPELSKYTACVKPNYEANEAWIRYARPSVNSALTITVTSIQLAEATKDKKLPWMQYLQPALCTLSEVLQQWQALLPDNIKNYIMLAVKTVSAVTCKK